MPVDHLAQSDALYFVSTLRPALVRGNLAHALRTVRAHWTDDELIDLLRHNDAEVRKIAALALALAGGRKAIAPLAVALHDSDACVSQIADHAMWSIWFRSGSASALGFLKCGCSHMTHRNLDAAIEKYSMAIERDPEFAEAHNQRAIAHFISERFEDSIADCKAALRLIPQHFGAMAGMGHCYSQLCKYAEARHAYRLALAIHPRLEGIEASLAHLASIMRDGTDPR